MGAIKFFDNYNNNQELQILTKKKLSINRIENILLYFDFTLDDIPMLFKFSENQRKIKLFVKNHRNKFDTLSKREKQVFVLVVNGKTTSEIGELLFVEPCTVSSHRKKIKEKLNLKSIFDWYKYAKAFELVEF